MAQQMTSGERVKQGVAGTASALAKEATGRGGEFGTQLVDTASVERLIDDWPNIPQKAARKMIERYGPPNEATPSRLIWFNNGPWKRTIVYRDEVPHNFPKPHTDLPWPKRLRSSPFHGSRTRRSFPAAPNSRPNGGCQQDRREQAVAAAAKARVCIGSGRNNAAGRATPYTEGASRRKSARAGADICDACYTVMRPAPHLRPSQSVTFVP